MGFEKYTTGGGIGGVHAFAIGTESLNRGDADIAWCNNGGCQGGSTDEEHPVIAQNLYRYQVDAERPGGRFEQVGMSWLKHGFTALAGTEFCASCTFQGDLGHSSGDWLGMGCEDPYWASLNGSQGSLGPRSEVNATSGAFPYPFVLPATGDPTLRKRMLVAAGDLADNAGNPDLRYFAEGQYIALDDAGAGNGFNNATFRETVVSGGSDLSFGGPLGGYPGVQMQEAIRAWKHVDPAVEITRVDYEENFLPARFNLAAKVHDNGDGTWRYEYALHNLNSHRSAQKFSIPLAEEVAVTGPGMHDLDHHSGEPYDTAGWYSVVDLDFGLVGDDALRRRPERQRAAVGDAVQLLVRRRRPARHGQCDDHPLPAWRRRRAERAAGRDDRPGRELPFLRRSRKRGHPALDGGGCRGRVRPARRWAGRR